MKNINILQNQKNKRKEEKAILSNKIIKSDTKLTDKISLKRKTLPYVLSIAVLSLLILGNHYIMNSNEVYPYSLTDSDTAISLFTGPILSKAYAESDNSNNSDKSKLYDGNNGYEEDNSQNSEIKTLSKGSVQEKSSNKGKFIAVVKVKNTSKEDYKGGIYINIVDSDISKHVYTKFPKGKTVTKTFEFKSEDVPVGTGFTVKVICGDDYDKMKHGVNGPSKKPEEIRFTIP